MHRYTLYNRIGSLLLAVLLVLTAVGPGMLRVSAAETEGSCGENLSWSFADGKLTISGTGAMDDFPETEMAPWYDYREQITALVLPEGLTRIGDLAFYQCTALRSVTIPDSVTEIGWHAFDGCSGITMLTLGKNLKRLEEAAFRECLSVKSIRLPDGLETIQYQAFYRCESLTEITVPASVKELGMTVFSFCGQLVRAEIRAELEILPDWTFYGCTKLAELVLPATMTGANAYAFYECNGLQEIEYSGDPENLEQIREDLNRDLEVESSLVSIGGSQEDTSDGDTTSSTTFEETEEGVVADTTTVTQTENTTISTETTVTYPADGSDPDAGDTQVDVTLENDQGWSEVVDYVEETVGEDTSVKMDIYVKDDSEIPQELLEALAGKNVTIVVHTSSGSQWQLDCSGLSGNNVSSGIGFNYECVSASEEQLFLMGCQVGYRLLFQSNSELNAEVMIQLPVENARKVATLYQINEDEIRRLQSVVVDKQGMAHFYLAAVDAETSYLIGMDISGEEASAIIPDNLASEYGITDRTGEVEYVLTGRKSSWNMELGQVTWILAAVMAGSVVAVGGVMFILNKRKNRMEVFSEEESE